MKATIRAAGRLALAATLLLLSWTGPLFALNNGAPVAYLYCYSGTAPASPLSWSPCSSLNPLNITGSLSATISGFPGSTQTTGTPIAVTTGGVTGTLPAGTTVVATNVGTTNAAYCKLGASASTSDQFIGPNGGQFPFTVGTNTQLTCITSASTTTVNMVGGAGISTGANGGGGGGSGGGGAITAASGSYASGALSSGSVASGAYASGAFASGSIGSGALASGSVASGAVASGAFSAGAYAAGAVVAGAFVDGWDLTQGTKADSAYAGSGSASVVAILKGIYALGASSVPYNVNGTPTAATALTPGSAQTGTIVAPNSDQTSMGGVAYGAMANFGTTPGAVKAPAANASLFVGTVAVPGSAGAVGTGTPRIAVGQDTTTIAGAAPGTAGTPSANVVTVQGAAGMTPAFSSADPCSQGLKTNLPISFQATASAQLIALSGSTKVYVCSLALIASVATNFSITGGTGTNCGTPAALIGTTSASNGVPLAANGGLTLGNGAGTVAVTGAGSELCIVQSGAGNIVGNLTYVQQ